MSYFKEYDYGVMEVRVEFPDDGGNAGTIIDSYVHPIGYKPKGDIVYER
jgi:hypothetical protein